MPGSWSDFLKLRSGPAPPPSSEAGAVRVYADADGLLRSVQSDGTDAPIGGGGSTSAAVVRGPYSFDHTDLAALADGVAFYTPTVDEILLDAWFEVDVAFGVATKADLSQYTGSGAPYGLFGYSTFPVDLNLQADTLDQGGGPLQGTIHGYTLVEETAASGGSGVARLAPARFTTADPLVVVVSQDGTRGGTPSAAVAGAARIYIVTAIPVAL